MQSAHSLRATFSAFPKTAWISLGFAVLFASASIKFVAIDDAADVALYPALGAIAFLVWPALSFAMMGTLEARAASLHWRRRIGLASSIARHEIARIESYGSRLNDSLGIRVFLTRGMPLTFPRVRPESMIALFEDYGRGPEAEAKPIPGREAFGAYAQGHVPNGLR